MGKYNIYLYCRFICISIIVENTNIEITVIIKLLVTAANIIAKVTSVADRGANNVSIIFPCILPIINDEEEWEKPCWIIDIAIRPGAKKLIKGHGRMLVRKSGTESKIRVMGESENKFLLLKCVKIVIKSIN